MILSDDSARDPVAERTTLDQLFRRAAVRDPHAIALADAPNRASVAGGIPRRLTYAQADRVISAIAAELRRVGLHTDSVVAIQLPNTVEGVLTLLGVLRAGMIAAPVPLLWRRAELIAALGQVGAKAIVTTSRVGEFDLGALAMDTAAAVFPIRCILGFGSASLDGVVSLDALLNADRYGPPPAVVREGNPAAHVAAVTWDVGSQGPVAVARNHRELIAGGLAIGRAAGLPQRSVILASFASTSFAGLMATMLPWLLTGGTLLLHHGFDAPTFANQVSAEQCDTLVVPGALAARLSAAGLFDCPAVRRVLAVWRAPERLSASPAWTNRTVELIDVAVFGEIGLMVRRRDPEGRAGPLPAREAQAGEAPLIEAIRSEAGTLALRGSMVPRRAFPPGAERLPAPHVRADTADFVDSGYPCRFDGGTDTFVVTAPPPGQIAIGGYRFVLGEIEALVESADGEARIAALPDAIVGHRFGGIASHAAAVRCALEALGANALVADAFRDRIAAQQPDQTDSASPAR